MKKSNANITDVVSDVLSVTAAAAVTITSAVFKPLAYPIMFGLYAARENGWIDDDCRPCFKEKSN